MGSCSPLGVAAASAGAVLAAQQWNCVSRRYMAFIRIGLRGAAAAAAVGGRAGGRTKCESNRTRRGLKRSP